jgi:hypothetical protein
MARASSSVCASVSSGDPIKALQAYPGLFRRSLEEDNRMCPRNPRCMGAMMLPSLVATPSRY